MVPYLLRNIFFSQKSSSHISTMSELGFSIRSTMTESGLLCLPFPPHLFQLVTNILFVIVTFSMTTLFHVRLHFSLYSFWFTYSFTFHIYIYYRLTTYSQSLTPHPTESEFLFILSLVVKLQKVYTI